VPATFGAESSAAEGVEPDRVPRLSDDGARPWSLCAFAE
jgi:hypothetical protein